MPTWLPAAGLVLDGWSSYLHLGSAGLRPAECWVMGGRCPLPLLPPMHCVSPAATSAFHFTHQTLAKNRNTLGLILNPAEVLHKPELLKS